MILSDRRNVGRLAAIRTARFATRFTTRCVLVFAALFVALFVASAISPPTALAQESAGTLVSRAIELERTGQNREAADAWRSAIAGGAALPGVLGLERVLSVLGEEAALLEVLDSILLRFPDEPQFRAAQMRTLVLLDRDAEADAAFRAWRDARPHEVAPYRDYARILLFNDRAAKADTILAEAGRTLGQTRALLLEQAQLRAALGRWREAAESWRETVRDQRYFEGAAAFSLGPAPVEARDSVRAALAVAGAPLAATQVLALLELGWGAPRAGWNVLAGLAPSESVIATWLAFAEEAERAQAWSTLRDALAAVQRVRPDPANGLRAAAAALRAQDALSALALVRAAGVPRVNQEALGIELEALARLGRGAEAESVLAAAAPTLGATGTRGFARTIAWAWVRAGDVARARLALRDAPLDAEDAVAGWLALYEGDLATARPALRYGEATTPEAVSALALLSRTSATQSANIGAAFLALARGDSIGATRAFEAAADENKDAASLLIALAARVGTARGADGPAAVLWTRLLSAHGTAPEAPEAHLELGRAQRRSGETAAAREHFERIILEFPTSALVPQARRELDALAMSAAPRGAP